MPNDTFQDWFCLKNRATFTIDPKVHPKDACLYFGRDTLRDRIKRQMSRAFIDPQVPKMMFYGSYGSGKTQTLYHLGYELGTNPPASCKDKPYIVHIDMEFQSKSMAEHWHLQLMEALGMGTVQGWLQTLFSNASKFDTEVDGFAGDTNIAMAFKQLRGGGDLAFASWRWLAGQRLAARELQEIKVTRNLADVGVGDMVEAVVAVGRLARAVGSCLIFFMDEMEEIQNVRQGDAAESWHQYTRKLADNSNSSVGFILGFKADTLDDAPRIIVRTDVISRIGKQNLIELETLAAPANVKAFVAEMLKFLIDHEKAEKLIKAESLPLKLQTYPFSESAFELMCDYACQDPHKSTPRNIIRTINECAMTAWDAEPKRRVIDDAIVNEIAPVVFG
jgi:DNA polymerase III delta prime subunit